MKALARGCLPLLLLIVIPAPGFGQTWLQNTFNINVSVTTTWTDTGIQVAVGDSLFIRAQGSVSDGAAGWDGWFGPEGMVRGQSGGCVDCPLTGFPRGALIARIGSGSPFYVGSFSSFSCNGEGVLYLGVNDNAPGSYVGTMRAFVWGGAAVPPPPVVNCEPGSCTSYISLGSIRGDFANDMVSYNANGARWFRIYVDEADGTMICMYLSATITLTPPPGADYDLFVYCDDCMTLAGSSTQGGSATEVVQVRWDEECIMGIPTGSDSGRYIYIRVDCNSVSVEDDWSLVIYGNTSVGINTCSTR
jgi:hypothetical protein